MRAPSLFGIGLLLTGVCAAQSSAPSAPCQTPEARQFDFWVGEWDLVGKTRGQPGAAWGETISTNRIESTLDGCVTFEHFENQSPMTWRGMSWSSWSPQLHQWQQTWVDNQGGYITLTGEFAAGRMILTTPPRTLPNGSKAVNRMVYHDIARDSLVWDWELSLDDGKTWQLMWGITYRRRK
jgi:uncharacterized protein DUF1579